MVERTMELVRGLMQKDLSQPVLQQFAGALVERTTTGFVDGS
jgi:hypothetical protein